jgi:hypothetical protein
MNGDATNGPEIADAGAAAMESGGRTKVALLPSAASSAEPENSSVPAAEPSGIMVASFDEAEPSPHPLTSEQEPPTPRLTDLAAVQPAVQRQGGLKRRLTVQDQAEEVQQKLIRFGYLAASSPGPWGARSREALRAFKVAHQLGADDAWDEATERVLFSPGVKPADSFVGLWGASPSACSQHSGGQRALLTVIDHRGAMAGDTFCAFAKKEPSGEAWTITARCENPRERWTAHVRLQTAGKKLSWSSQRGTQVYSRCEDRVLTAQASL